MASPELPMASPELPGSVGTRGGQPPWVTRPRATVLCPPRPSVIAAPRFILPGSCGCEDMNGPLDANLAHIGGNAARFLALQQLGSEPALLWVVPLEPGSS